MGPGMGAGAGIFELVPVLVAIGFVAFPVVLVLGYLNNRKRTEQFAALATGRGWVHRADDDALVGRFGDVLPGRQGRRAGNSLTGTVAGRPVVAFEYRWTTSSGTGTDSTSTPHSRYVVAVDAGAVDLERVRATLARGAGDVEVTRSVDSVVVVRRSVAQEETSAWIDAVVAAVVPAGPAAGPQDGDTWVER